MIDVHPITSDYLTKGDAMGDVHVLLSRRDVAELMGLNVETIKYHRGRGSMPEPDHVIDDKPLWRRETINQWIASRKKDA